MPKKIKIQDIKARPIEDEIVTVRMRRGTNQKSRVLATLEGMSVQDYWDWMIDQAYQARQIVRPTMKKQA